MTLCGGLLWVLGQNLKWSSPQLRHGSQMLAIWLIKLQSSASLFNAVRFITPLKESRTDKHIEWIYIRFKPVIIITWRAHLNTEVCPQVPSNSLNLFLTCSGICLIEGFSSNFTLISLNFNASFSVGQASGYSEKSSTTNSAVKIFYFKSKKA